MFKVGLPVWCLVLVSGLVLGMDTRDPGMKARITAKGLNYVNYVIREIVKDDLQHDRKCPDTSGTFYGIHWTLSNMVITNFTEPLSQLTADVVRGTNLLTWALNNITLSIHGNFKFKKWFFEDAGTFDCEISQISLSLGVIVEIADGRLAVHLDHAKTSVRNIQFQFHGWASWFYRLFRHEIKDRAKRKLEHALDQSVVKAVDVNSRRLHRLPLTEKLGEDFMFAYRLLDLDFTQPFIQSQQEGEIYWASDGPVRTPLRPPPLNTGSDTQKMVFVSLSEYTFNTGAYFAQLHRVLQFNLTPAKLPPGREFLLDTSCPNNLCIGRRIPELAQRYPNTTVELDMVSRLQPRMTITSAGIFVQCTGIVEMYLTNRSPGPRLYLLSLRAAMNMTIDAFIANTSISGRYNNFNLMLDLIRSDIGNISDAALFFIRNEPMGIVLRLKLTSLLQRGFPLPVPGGFTLVNATLTLNESFVLIATDLQLKKENQDTTLRFESKEKMAGKDERQGRVVNK